VDDLRSIIRVAGTGHRRRKIGDLISYQNDGKDCTAIAGKAGGRA
jgi:hypothetical protein